MRVRGGILTMLYAKTLRLRSLQDKTVGQVSNQFKLKAFPFNCCVNLKDEIVVK